jgi:hypothetical protein
MLAGTDMLWFSAFSSISLPSFIHAFVLGFQPSVELRLRVLFALLLSPWMVSLCRQLSTTSPLRLNVSWDHGVTEEPFLDRLDLLFVVSRRHPF